MEQVTQGIKPWQVTRLLWLYVKYHGLRGDWLFDLGGVLYAQVPGQRTMVGLRRCKTRDAGR